MFIRVTHLTRYDYSQPVHFAPHALYLRPRETPRQRVHRFALEVAPAARLIATSDPHDNPIEWAYFTGPEPNERLEFRSDFTVEALDSNPFDFFLQEHAQSFPFAYEATERHALAPSLAPRADSPPAATLLAWVKEHLPNQSSSTVSFLGALNGLLYRSFAYIARDEPGIQSAADTLRCGSGSCRDYAVLFIELCRALGLAARFVSGYVCEPPPEDRPPRREAMHAWAEVYLPGAGWRGLDPTRGIFCDDSFVAVAHSPIAERVSPVQGAFYGPAGTTSTLSTELAVVKV